MRFLVDVCVDVRVAQWLREQGHVASHLREEGLQRLPNGQIFVKAVSEQRVVITHDLDFGEIASSSAGAKASVIVFRLHNVRLSNVLGRLKAVLEDCAPVLEQGAIISVEETRHRIRHFPIGS
jgi:predicted nuclease of predicted toxin-antitoxin system